jgi:hypothetical protein
MGGEEDFLVVSHGSYFQVVFNGAEPIVCIERSGTLGEHGWICVLEVPKA